MTDIRLVQLARMLSLPAAGLDAATARRLIAERTGDFAGAIFAEAAQNDDVTSTTAALEYLEARLLEFGDLVDDNVTAAALAAFGVRLAAWEQPPAR